VKPGGTVADIWMPIQGAGSVWFTIFLLSVLLIFTLLGSAVVRLPGFVPGNKRRSSGPILLGVLALLASPACAICAALILLPLGCQQTLVLSSRARGPDNAQWAARWGQVTKTALSTGVPTNHLFDAGVVVDSICSNLVARHGPQAWRIQDPTERTLLSSVVFETLAKSESLPTAVDSLRRVSQSSQASLPRWVVESVEVSALKGLAEEHKCGSIVVLGTDRQTKLGPVWESFRTYLSLSPSLRAPRRVNLFTNSDEGALRIVQVLGFAEPSSVSHTIGLKLLLGVPGQNTNKADMTLAGFRLRDATHELVTSQLRVPLALRPSVLPVTVTFANPEPSLFDRTGLTLEVFDTEGTLHDTRAVSPGTGRSGTGLRQVYASFGISAEPPFNALHLANAWKRATGFMRMNAALGSWRSQMEASGWSLAPLEKLSSRFGQAGDVMIDVLPSGLLVRPGWASSLRARFATVSAPVYLLSPLRGRSTSLSVPGYYSFLGLPIGAVPDLMGASASGTEVSAVALLLDRDDGGKQVMDLPEKRATLLRAGQELRSAISHPLVTRFSISIAGDAGTATFIDRFAETNSLVPWWETQSLTPSENGDDIVRAAAAWTVLLQAVQMALVPSTPEGTIQQEEAENEAHAEALLDSGQLARLRVIAARKYGAFLLLSLLLFATPIVIGLRSLLGRVR